MHAKLLQSCPRLATPWTVACQAPLSVGFSRQEYWSGLSCPPPGDLPDPGIKPTSLTSHALAGRFFTKNTSATVLYTACFSYSIFIFFTRWLCSFTHQELEPIFPSPKSALALQLVWGRKMQQEWWCGVPVQSKVSSAFLASLCSFSWKPEQPLWEQSQATCWMMREHMEPRWAASTKAILD